ncbi:hypothetical protein EJB05_25600, partial [Eragrostis curvula]
MASVWWTKATAQYIGMVFYKMEAWWAAPRLLFLWSDSSQGRRFLCCSSPSSSSSELLQLFCFKKPPALASTFTVHDPHAAGDDDETVEAQLMRLGNLVGPPRLLFTIKEETKEDLESEDGRSRCGRSRSLADLLHCPGTPFLTPASSPAPPSIAAADNSYNPLFESPMASPGPAPPAVSPPPKFQFLKDAEEKLYRRRWPRRPCARGGRRRRWPARRKAGTSPSWSGRTTELSCCRRRPAAVDISSEMVHAFSSTCLIHYSAAVF